MERDAALLGMGTTVASALLKEQTLAIAHVGDSRANRRRNGRLELLTHDHTWVYEQMIAGYLSEAEAQTHPLKSVVTRALGGDGDFTVDVTEVPVWAGDVFLLCSDGLNTMLSDDEIDAWLAADATSATGVSSEEICTGLVNDANARGGVDNVNVVLLYVEDAGDTDTERALVPQVAERLHREALASPIQLPEQQSYSSLLTNRRTCLSRSISNE